MVCETYLLVASFLGIVSTKKLRKFAEVTVTCMTIAYGFVKYSDFLRSLAKLLLCLEKAESAGLL